jgi:uncharacterized surface protein with fasciclin (FAS1) repeats
MSSVHSSRQAFLKAVGVSLLGVPALSGMVAPLAARGALKAGPNLMALIPEKALSVADLSTLAALIMNSSTVYPTLEGAGPFTLFAPTNSAWAQLPPSRQRQLNDQTILQNVLEYHVLNGAYSVRQLVAGEYTTLLSLPVTISRTGPIVSVNKALIEGPQIPAINGVIHVITKVLMTGFRQ